MTDPDYFDFISFAQYASVADAIRNGRDFFEEKVGADGEKRTVQRDADFKDNARLPDEHARRVGDKILVSECLVRSARGGGREGSVDRLAKEAQEDVRPRALLPLAF